MKRYFLPIKREIWEFHGTFIKTPIIVLSVFIAILLIAAIAGRNLIKGSDFSLSSQSNDSSYSLSFGDQQTFSYQDEIIGQTDDAFSSSLPSTSLDDVVMPQSLREGANVLASIPYIIFDHLALLLIFMYALSCLYSDRKNNSVLFWKSMPVSEWQNVLTKVFVATLLLPAIAWLTALVFSLFLLVFVLVGAVFSAHQDAVQFVWQHQHILSTAWGYIGTSLAVSLWLLPCICWVLLASAFAKKTPFLYVVLPLVGIVVFEHLVLGSHYFAMLLGGYLDTTNSNTQQNMLISASWQNLWDVLSNSLFWCGLVASGLMLYATVWLREHRFEV